jgi:hypothetical protein
MLKWRETGVIPSVRATCNDIKELLWVVGGNRGAIAEALESRRKIQKKIKPIDDTLYYDRLIQSPAVLRSRYLEADDYMKRHGYKAHWLEIARVFAGLSVDDFARFKTALKLKEADSEGSEPNQP